MKGGLAVIARLLDSPDFGTGWARVGAVLYAGEEGPIEQNDLRRILQGAARWVREADLVLLLEPTDLQIEVGCVGVVNVEVIFRGEACHSARPWLGTNAVEVALPWLATAIRFQPIEHEISGYVFRETASLTTLQAGTARNVIPGELVANLNYRYPPGWSQERGQAAARSLAAGASEVRIVDVAPSGQVPLEQPHFAAFVQGSGCRSRAKQAWTDVAQFSEIDVPALNFGPGDPNLAHRDDERVRIGALEECYATIQSFLEGSAPFGGARTG
jgi:succinyl-diaminopimelate desuccinylase